LWESNEKKEVLEKISKMFEWRIYRIYYERKWVFRLSSRFKRTKSKYYSYKDKLDSIEFATYAELKDKEKKAFLALRNKDASITSEMEHKLLDLQVSIKRI